MLNPYKNPGVQNFDVSHGYKRKIIIALFIPNSQFVIAWKTCHPHGISLMFYEELLLTILKTHWILILIME